MLPESVCTKFRADVGFDLEPSLAFACYVGSRSHNTHVPKEDPGSFDDIDIACVVVPPPARVYGIAPWHPASKQIQIDEWDVTAHSLSKFVALALKGNPSILCQLWTRPEDRLHVASHFLPFIFERRIFSSRQVVKAFLGYAQDQFRKMTAGQLYAGYMGEKRKRLVERHGFDIKNAAHLIRLLRMCVEFAADGELRVWREGDDAQQIRDIKTGRWCLGDVKIEAERLELEARRALTSTSLPDMPNAAMADELLLGALATAWGAR